MSCIETISKLKEKEAEAINSHSNTAKELSLEQENFNLVHKYEQEVRTGNEEIKAAMETIQKVRCSHICCNSSLVSINHVHFTPHVVIGYYRFCSWAALVL